VSAPDTPDARPRPTFRWPEDSDAAVADWLDRYPPPPLTPEQTRVIVDTVYRVFDADRGAA
jgi:hypothetical protein